MAPHSNQTLPGPAFFFPQRLAQIRKNEELMRLTFLPKFAASQTPTCSGTTWKPVRKCLRRLSFEAGIKSDIRRRPTEQQLLRLREQFYAGSVDQAQKAGFVEGK